ncbi:16S rRNA (cytosine(1402)-N(4))-methyltransferase RsmH [Bartonella sp. HY329]|uniref:16S rRNA (cytosine(1402)-N(4))-methyltransferase RsmH n=1 Tax=unclassified Bartonella TaxID=2645622 RepID=UPI0021C9098C|nr:MULTISPECIES: 16S rRNA (cytosine(1402)-N(4))-methyltransferase RsmH [unclassified Bartonella]UXM95876.1 16S rRNA (cytosine(1402)-N(4))-methyltransferase RsmH [Bartonella sp. HY329]UXN10201.1 16S rRNA (cytosine(1402)-N(4))-methyltransferase RsmH [Bartonella sp. HY328]
MTEGYERHIPVMLGEVCDSVEPLDGAIIVDGTFGAGGYSRGFLEKGAHVIALDRDPNAIAGAKPLLDQYKGRLTLIETAFSNMAQVIDEKVDAVVLDIGVSSMQIDEAERGFSFQKDGPLDMRMSQKGVSAADVVNRLKAGDLARIFGFLGEERHAGRIARMIEARRETTPFTRTSDLAKAIEATIGRKPNAIHPATRVFQALRIYVNDELGELAKALLAAEQILKPGGKLAVVTFHSLEDRLVKRFFADRSGKRTQSRHMPDNFDLMPVFEPLFKGAMAASDGEIDLNPRSRSAKLRVGVRTNNPAFGDDMAIFQLAELAPLKGHSR